MRRFMHRCVRRQKSPDKFYPAKAQGLETTFPHQNYNGYGRDDLPWRAGDLCLNTSVRILGRHGYDIEPYDVHQRLKWQFRRALAWLRAASRGELILPGEPFELPQFPGAAQRSEAVVFCEDADSFLQWQNIPERSGLLDLFRLRRKSAVFIIKAFRTVNGREVFAPTWWLALHCRRRPLHVPRSVTSARGLSRSRCPGPSAPASGSPCAAAMAGRRTG